MFRRKIYGLTALLLGVAVPAHAAQGRPVVNHRGAKHADRTSAVSKKTVPPAEQATATGEPTKTPERTQAQTQQTEARRLQEAALKAQQAQLRYAEETQKLLQEQARQTQEVSRSNLAKVRESEESERAKREVLRKAHQRELQEMQQAADVVQSPDKNPNDQEPKIESAELDFKKEKADILRTSFSGPRKTTDRDKLPPINVRGVSPQKAATQPFVIKTATGEQRRQVQTFQQNIQARLLALPASQTPIAYADLKTSQTNAYFNNYPAYVNHEAITIDKKNTYIREVPPTKYPAWYERIPGWTYCNAFVLGSSVQVGEDWFGWDWPAMLGPVPKGFLCQPEYFPTPWIYSPFNDHWRLAGEQEYKAGPDPEYTGPITVETIEPVTARMPDQYGVPVSQTINVLYFYNAFYNPEFQRWGYVNKQGSFVWLNI